jgi:hypothetical protein
MINGLTHGIANTLKRIGTHHVSTVLFIVSVDASLICLLLRSTHRLHASKQHWVPIIDPGIPLVVSTPRDTRACLFTSLFGLVATHAY